MVDNEQGAGAGIKKNWKLVKLTNKPIINVGLEQSSTPSIHKVQCFTFALDLINKGIQRGK
jgi:hypothetical protein